MPLTLRLVKGSPLTNSEVDGNFTYLDQKPATNIAGGTFGSIPYQTAVNTTALISIGPTGYVLTSNGTSSAPSWQKIDALPSQTSNSGKFLTTDGTSATWETLPSIPTLPTFPTGDIVGTTDSQTLTNKKLSCYTEKVVVVGTVSSTTYNINLSTSNIFEITLGNNVTFTFTNPPAAGTSINCTVILKQDSVGNRTANFTNAKWTDGIAPILSTDPNDIDVLGFFTYDGGTSYFGSFALANLS